MPPSSHVFDSSSSLLLITTFILVNLNTLIMPDSRDLFSEATELVKPGRLDEVLALFPALLKTDSNNSAVWNNPGIIRF